MSNDDEGRLSKSLDYLNWALIMRAVLNVFQENGTRHEQGLCSYKPSADVWANNSSMLNDVNQRACEYWCKISGYDLTYYPYSTDGIARFYFRFRKRNKEEIDEFEREIDLELERYHRSK